MAGRAPAGDGGGLHFLGNILPDLDGAGGQALHLLRQEADVGGGVQARLVAGDRLPGGEAAGALPVEGRDIGVKLLPQRIKPLGLLLVILSRADVADGEGLLELGEDVPLLGLIGMQLEGEGAEADLFEPLLDD